jgi:hypothetical protein
LRLDLRRNEAALHSDIAELGSLLDRAKASYTHLAAARGSYRSGATEHWLSEWTADKTKADELVTAAAAYRSDCAGFCTIAA